jgi:7-cyano-7-deazaguanine synthase
VTSTPWADPSYTDVLNDIRKADPRVSEQFPIEDFISPSTISVPTRFEPMGAPAHDGVAIVSGGMDSITMVYELIRQGHYPHLLSFDYGQRHKKELDYALMCAERLSLNWSLIDLSSITELIGNSALTSKPKPWEAPGVVGDMFEGTPAIDVPEGHYAEDNMAITVVPNRNMMMVSIAGAVAVNAKYKYVAAGMHAGDHAQYPDCRPEFIEDVERALHTANEGFIPEDFIVMTPWLYKSKNDIAQAAYDLTVPLHLTWSCYKGGAYHCGRCATCVERLEAVASVPATWHWDHTIYEDTEYWKQVVADWKATH